jgi:hypothetical protein
MPRQSINLRLEEGTYQELHRLHAGYGEAQRVIRQLVEAYVAARQATRSEVDALAEAVLGRIR